MGKIKSVNWICGASKLLAPTTLACCAVMVLSACESMVMSSIKAANRAEQISIKRNFSAAVKDHFERIRNLQAKGDPLGDYLWVLAQAEGMTEPPLPTPKELERMYKEAAAKGSTDAMVALGLMHVLGTSSPQRGKAGLLKDRNWREGLAWLEKGTRERCWYFVPVFDALVGGPPMLRTDSPWGWVWPQFRDGDGVPQNMELANALHEKHLACEKQMKSGGGLYDARYSRYMHYGK